MCLKSGKESRIFLLFLVLFFLLLVRPGLSYGREIYEVTPEEIAQLEDILTKQSAEIAKLKTLTEKQEASIVKLKKLLLQSNETISAQASILTEQANSMKKLEESLTESKAEERKKLIKAWLLALLIGIASGFTTGAIIF